jgi:hypothetical protein
MQVAPEKLVYYTRDTGQKRLSLLHGRRTAPGAIQAERQTWVPLNDGWYLMDMIIDRNPELSGPVKNPPQGVPAIKDKIKPHERTPAARSSGVADTGS